MKKDILDRLLAMYRFWGITATAAFTVFLFLIAVVYRLKEFNLALLFLALLAGFLWIGATSISRHCFVLLKNYIGGRVSLVEFLSTQFVVFLFPFAYRKVRAEAEDFRMRRGQAQE